jgi:hypothetical protein
MGGIYESNRLENATYYMTYAEAVLALLESGYTMRRDANPEKNETGWAVRDGIFGHEDIFIGWIDANGGCPSCAAAELAKA